MILSRGSRFRSAILVGTILLLSCGDGGDRSVPPLPSVRLATTVSNAELESRLKAELTSVYQRQEFRYRYTGIGEFGPGAGDGFGGETQNDSTSPPYSETNVQEAGVDEGDLVKTDGNFIFLARGSRFFVLQARPPEGMMIVSDIDLQEPISELYLVASRLTVLTNLYTVAAGPVTRLYHYDVTTPVTPVLTARLDFPGMFQGSRRINDTIYVVTNHHIDLAAAVSPWDYYHPVGSFDQNAFNEAVAKATAENLRRIAALTLADLLPTYSRTVYSGGVGGTPSVDFAVGVGDLYLPETGNGTDLSLVFAINTAPAEPTVTSSGVLSAWCRLYMSPENLYLASENDWNWIEPIAGTNPSTDNPEPWTALHKFAVADGIGRPLYRGSGVVNGWLNDQFSMGEYNGNLRIGTTRGGWWGEGISNQLAIFTEQDGALKMTGKIANIAPGERIYAMRFDRDRGYMVTFRQTDPLFTFDLSDPAQPRTVGELKVDGFATYMQLIGPEKNRLLTIGRSADATGQVTGNKLQLFDVTNLTAPLLLGSFELGAGWSSALYDHHAFLYYAPLDLLTIPYFGYDATTAGYSSGLRVFNVGASTITLRGTIPAQAISSGYGPYEDTVDRAVIIGRDIYALAHRSVTVAGADLLDIKKLVGLPEGYGDYSFSGGVPAALQR